MCVCVCVGGGGFTERKWEVMNPRNDVLLCIYALSKPNFSIFDNEKHYFFHPPNTDLEQRRAILQFLKINSHLYSKREAINLG